VFGSFGAQPQLLSSQFVNDTPTMQAAFALKYPQPAQDGGVS